MQRSSLVKEMVNARIALKNLETLTYNFTEIDYDHATALVSDLKQLYSKYQALLPKSRGLLLHPKSNTKMRRKARLALKCSSLPSKKSRSSKRVRVGSKAERQQKVNFNAVTDDLIK